jgi:Leucine-rich repeat (LRR) protein
LNCDFNPLTDLRAIRELPLKTLSVSGTQVRDLGPLQGLALESLSVTDTPASDLSPLKGMPLLQLHLNDTQVSDLAPLEGMLLDTLTCSNTKVRDLSPLKNMMLATLLCERTGVTDFSPIRNLPLHDIACEFNLQRDGALFKSLWTLQRINNKPAYTFWETYDPKHADLLKWIIDAKKLGTPQRIPAVQAKLMALNPKFDPKTHWKAYKSSANFKVNELKLVSDELTELAPLRAMPALTHLDCNGSGHNTGKLTDLSPLRGMPLQHLQVLNNPDLNDLSPLRGMQLTDVGFAAKDIAAMGPLAEMPIAKMHVNRRFLSFPEIQWLPLTSLTFVNPLDPSKVELETLKKMCRLQVIEGQPAIEFWKKYDPAHAAFLQWVEDNQKLSPEQQIAAFKDKMKERNPSFRGNSVTFQSANGKITELVFHTVEVTDIAPVRAFAALERLQAGFSRGQPGALADLSPLAGMKLKQLDIRRNPVQNLLPLRGMPLEELEINNTQVGDLSVLRTMPLTVLNIRGCPVGDLQALRDLPLRELHCERTQVTDLSPLRGSVLQVIVLDQLGEKDAEILRSMPSLQTINAKAAVLVLSQPLASTPPPAEPATAQDEPVKPLIPVVKDTRRTLWQSASGTFQYLSGNDWHETTGPQKSRDWVEKTRTDDYVELFDVARNLIVRLYNDRQMENADGKSPFRKVRDGEWEKVFLGLGRTEFNDLFNEFTQLKPNKWHPTFVKGYDGKDDRLDITWRSAPIPGGWSLYSSLKTQKDLAGKNAEMTKLGTPIILCQSRFKVNGQERIAAIWIGGERNYWHGGVGKFELVKDKDWSFKSLKHTYQFVERSRNDEFIDLFDQSRNVRVRIYFDHYDLFTNNNFDGRTDGNWEIRPSGPN